jgi:hypothetical protein
MGLQVEIVERSSVIVVTLTGPTDIAALEPLHDALQVAASEGQTVVLDLRELTHSTPLTDMIAALGSAVATLMLVVPSTTGSPQSAVPGLRDGDPIGSTATGADAAATERGQGDSQAQPLVTPTRRRWLTEQPKLMR